MKTGQTNAFCICRQIEFICKSTVRTSLYWYLVSHSRLMNVLPWNCTESISVKDGFPDWEEKEIEQTMQIARLHFTNYSNSAHGYQSPSNWQRQFCLKHCIFEFIWSIIMIVGLAKRKRRCIWIQPRSRKQLTGTCSVKLTLKKTRPDSELLKPSPHFILVAFSTNINNGFALLSITTARMLCFIQKQ